MTERARLLQAVNELEATIRESFRLGDQDFNNNRQDALRLRRLITERMAEISSLSDRCLDGSILHGQFRSAFSKMRSAMAFHHASWPIVAIDLESAEYTLSAAKLREATDSFILWVKTVLSRPD